MAAAGMGNGLYVKVRKKIKSSSLFLYAQAWLTDCISLKI